MKFDDVIESGFWVVPRITSAALYKPIHDIINYSIFTGPFESGKCGKEAKKLQKFDYLKNKKSFTDEINFFFYSLWRAIIREKINSFKPNNMEKWWILRNSANIVCQKRALRKLANKAKVKIEIDTFNWIFEGFLRCLWIYNCFIILKCKYRRNVWNCLLLIILSNEGHWKLTIWLNQG